MTLLEIFVEFGVWFIESFELLGVFITMSLESCLIPIPSEIIMPFAGFVAWEKRSIEFFLSAVLMGVIGNVVGSASLYFIGVHGGRLFIERYGRYFLVTEEKLYGAEEWFKKYGSYSIFFGRMLPAVRTVISLPAGVFRYSFPKFLLLTFIGSIPWNLALTYLGYLLGEYWIEITRYSTLIDVLGIILLVGLIIFFLRRAGQPPETKIS